MLLPIKPNPALMLIATFLFATVSTLTLYSAPVLAEQRDAAFTSQQLKNTRKVAQALLKVRGQKRRQVLAETEGLRKDIKQLRSLLQQAKHDIDIASISISQVTQQNHYTAQPEFSLQQQGGNGKAIKWVKMQNPTFKGNKDKAQKNNPLSKMQSKHAGIKQRLENTLKQTQQLTKQRRQVIADQLPEFWQFWKKPDAGKQRIHDKLIAIEQNLEIIREASGIQRKQHITALLEQLQSPTVVQSLEPTPTLSTRTRHYRKGENQ